MPNRPSIPTNSRPQTANISTVELLRGLAATLVCLYHFTHGNHNFISEGNWVKAVASKGWLGVEIFFVISGFIIPYSMARSQYQLRNLPRFLLKRWLRIDPPYWMSIVFVLLLNALATLWLAYTPKASLTQVLLHFGYLIPFFPEYKWLNGVYWTLAVEFQYYILIALIYPLLHHQKRIYFWLCTLLLMGIGVFSSLPALFFDYSMFFVLGFALFRRFEKRMGEWEFLLFSASVFGAIFYKHTFQHVLASFFPWILIAYWPDLRVRGLRWLGMISYSLYLIHLPLGKRIIPWAARYIEGDWPRLGFVVLLLGFTLLLARGFYELIEKRAITWSKKVKMKDERKGYRSDFDNQS